MKTFQIALLAVFLATPAFGETPTEESVLKLLSLTRVDATVDIMYGGLEQSMRQGMKQAVTGKTLTPEQERALDLFPSKFVAVLREELSSSQLKSIYVQIYTETFDQKEVDGLIAFYESPAGQSFIAKMPLVIQRSMQASQARMQQYMPRIRRAMEDALKEAGISK